MLVFFGGGSLDEEKMELCGRLQAPLLLHLLRGFLSCPVITIIIIIMDFVFTFKMRDLERMLMFQT